jgi:hypothetical protein
MSSRDTGAIVTVVNGDENPIPVVFAGMATQSDLEDHVADTTNVHGISDTANLAYQVDLAAHTDDTTAAHAASAISFDPTASGMTATTVQAALDELKALIAAL